MSEHNWRLAPQQLGDKDSHHVASSIPVYHDLSPLSETLNLVLHFNPPKSMTENGISRWAPGGSLFAIAVAAVGRAALAVVVVGGAIGVGVVVRAVTAKRKNTRG